MRLALALGLSLIVGGIAGGACGGDDEETSGPIGAGAGGSFPEQTGSKCDVPADCYPGLDAGTLQGEVLCLDRVRDGYCTHLCDTDEDCCAVEGECKSGIEQVCAPFESTGQRMCFLSCEEGDLVGTDDEQYYCQHEASPEFICRSSGGGSENRKVCVPGACGVGASCTVTADCGAGLECYTTLGGTPFATGYCSETGCTSDGECPQNTRCVTLGDTNYCARSCTGQVDCDFCRNVFDSTHCTATANFVDTAGSGQVCLP